jgi:hypothetical protein
VIRSRHKARMAAGAWTVIPKADALSASQEGDADEAEVAEVQQ